MLVVKPRPSWWVKIADFGISKRFDEATALRTMYIGTQGYMAPEVLGIIHPDDNDFDPSNNLTYDQKVDMWALGEITYRMLACQPCFANPRLLNFYVIRDSTFPLGPLREAAASSACCDFVRAAMAPRPRTRMSAAEGLAHDWINALLDVDVGSLSLNEAPAGEDTYVLPSDREEHRLTRVAPEAPRRRRLSASFRSRIRLLTSGQPSARASQGKLASNFPCLTPTIYLLP